MQFSALNNLTVRILRITSAVNVFNLPIRSYNATVFLLLNRPKGTANIVTTGNMIRIKTDSR